MWTIDNGVSIKTKESPVQFPVPVSMITQEITLGIILLSFIHFLVEEVLVTHLHFTQIE